MHTGLQETPVHKVIQPDGVLVLSEVNASRGSPAVTPQQRHTGTSRSTQTLRVACKNKQQYRHIVPQLLRVDAD